MTRSFAALALAAGLLAQPCQAQFAGFQNKGLVAVGRIPASSFDAAGGHSDTLGGMFSAMEIDQPFSIHWNRGSSHTHHAVLHALADRGFGDGLTDFRPRVHTLEIRVKPYYGTTPTTQDQIKFDLDKTRLLTDSSGANFTGYNATAPNSAFPKSPAGNVLLPDGSRTPASLGAGRRSLDAEGLARRADGTFYVSDEYGPFIYRFSASGRLIGTIMPPDGVLPKAGASFGARTLDFSGADPRPDSGRNDNRGFEGLSLTPDGRRLVAVLQSPLMQDSGSGGTQRNAANIDRILIYDVQRGSSNENKLVGEYVLQLSVTTTTEGTRQTPVSEILALNDHQFLVLERDSYGRGQTDAGRDTISPIKKTVVLIDTAGATNIANTGYDLEKGAPGQTSFPFNTLPAGVTPVQRLDLVEIVDAQQLAKFGLNISPHTGSNTNSLTEKWEGLAILPLGDRHAPDDYLLFIGNDNDFKTAQVVHGGVIVGTNPIEVDNMLLAWRVTLPGVQRH